MNIVKRVAIKKIIFTGVLFCSQLALAGEVSIGRFLFDECIDFNQKNEDMILNEYLLNDDDPYDPYQVEESIQADNNLLGVADQFYAVRTACRRVYQEATRFGQDFIFDSVMFSEKGAMKEHLDRMGKAYAALNRIWFGKKVKFNQERAIAQTDQRSKVLLSKTLDLLSVYNEKAASGSQSVTEVFNYFYEKVKSAEPQNTDVAKIESIDQQMDDYQPDFLYKVLDIAIADLKARRSGSVLRFAD